MFGQSFLKIVMTLAQNIPNFPKCDFPSPVTPYLNVELDLAFILRTKVYGLKKTTIKMG